MKLMKLINSNSWNIPGIVNPKSWNISWILGITSIDFMNYQESRFASWNEFLFETPLRRCGACRSRGSVIRYSSFALKSNTPLSRTLRVSKRLFLTPLYVEHFQKNQRLFVEKSKKHSKNDVWRAIFGLLKHNFYSLKSNTPLSRTLCSKNTSIHLRAGISNTEIL